MKRCNILHCGGWWLSALLLLWLAPAAKAESYFGAHYGVGVSTIYFKPHQNETWRLVPYNAGLVYRYFAERETYTYVGLQVELNYGTRRYRFSDIKDVWVDDGDGIGSTQKVDTASKKVISQVIELPLIMQIRLPITQNFKIYANGIFYAAYYLKNEEFFFNNITQQQETHRFNYSNLNNFDFGIGGGLGAGYLIGTVEIGFDVRFMMGISEVFAQTIDRYESLPQQLLLSLNITKKF
ncbi:hypothetical protein FACS1894156_7190 [Bacteroidia bacterium]|nr:hypothetical protein FACS1894156_7190 [Bacteroidia bacterium]